MGGPGRRVIRGATMGMIRNVIRGATMGMIRNVTRGATPCDAEPDQSNSPRS